MALINCPACDRSVSSAAAACVHCGHPLGGGDAGKSVTTTQLTAKKYKGLQAVAALLLSLGVICIIATEPIWGSLFFASGLLLYIYARVAAWWKHG